MMILTWLILGFVIYYIVTNKGGQDFKSSSKKNPDEILKERYINGEIDEETFKSMKAILNS